MTSLEGETTWMLQPHCGAKGDGGARFIRGLQSAWVHRKALQKWLNQCYYFDYLFIGIYKKKSCLIWLSIKECMFFFIIIIIFLLGFGPSLLTFSNIWCHPCCFGLWKIGWFKTNKQSNTSFLSINILVSLFCQASSGHLRGIWEVGTYSATCLLSFSVGLIAY